MAKTPERILVVNDHEQTRYLASRLLKNAGYEVHEAATGEEALRKLAVEPDLVLLDVKLPDMSGFQVCHLIKSRPESNRPLVLQLSATFVTTEKRIEGLDGGADGYMCSPYEPMELLAQVRALLRLASAERELRLRAQFLEDADVRKDEFLAMLAHELRNPLAAITSALPLLAIHRADPARHEQVRSMVGRQTNNLAHMVDDLLDVARVTRGKIQLHKRPLDLGQVLQQAVQTVRSHAEARGQDLTLEVPQQTLVIQGDATRVEQIFVNIIDNASKYTPQGGAIAVKLARLAVDGVGPGPAASVVVRDNGMGISSEALPHVFDLFVQEKQTLERARGGMGIGLTMVQRLVALHEGQVHIRSKGVGQGTEVDIHLPLADPDEIRAMPTAPADAPFPMPTQKGRRIVLIEDNLDAQAALQELLEIMGHEVRTAVDGEAGVAQVEKFLPDVVLSDVGLPRLDGYGVARAIRSKELKPTPFLIALTGYGGPEQRDRALQAGFNVHLVKPVDPGALARLFEDL